MHGTTLRRERDYSRGEDIEVGASSGIPSHKSSDELYPSRFDFLGKVAVFMFLLITVVYRLHVPMIREEQILLIPVNQGGVTAPPATTVPEPEQQPAVDRLGRVIDTFAQKRYTDDIPEDAADVFRPKSEPDSSAPVVGNPVDNPVASSTSEPVAEDDTVYADDAPRSAAVPHGSTVSELNSAKGGAEKQSTGETLFSENESEVEERKTQDDSDGDDSDDDGDISLPFAS